MEHPSVIDVHTHPLVHERQHLLELDHTAEDYLSKVDGHGFERAAALVIAPRGDLGLTRELNDAVLELCDRHDGFFFAACSVHPADGDAAAAELERVAARGATWVKLHPNTQDFDVADPMVAATVGAATSLGLPVLFDAYSPWDRNQPGKFIQLAIKVPDARLILAHAHGPDFPSLLAYEILARYPWWPRQVWIDLSATAPLLSGGPFAEQLVWILRKVGTDRLLFGSDYPLDDPVDAVRGVRALPFDERELTAILHDNAATLLGAAAP